ncbi:MAG: coenzyme F420-0:L-glutamate ligase [Variibacter sp.]|nr:coenzyme F420-0:L-glutamate ligase [Variibacter sp.]
MGPDSTMRLDVLALRGIPAVQPGDDLAALITSAAAQSAVTFRDRDVVVVAQKIVSKAEGRVVALAGVRPSPQAQALAAKSDKDARLVEVILSESKRIVRQRPGVIIAEHRLGFVMANAGVDRSNVGPQSDDERVVLLPLNPDASAARLSAALSARHGCRLPVIVSDSFGRAWRNGTAGIAIGAAGLPSLRDRRGAPDLFGRPLHVTTIGFADEIAGAASLLMGQADEGRPVVIVRGLAWEEPESSAQALIRPSDEDLFR